MPAVVATKDFNGERHDEAQNGKTRVMNENPSEHAKDGPSTALFELVGEQLEHPVLMAESKKNITNGHSTIIDNPLPVINCEKRGVRELI